MHERVDYGLAVLAGIMSHGEVGNPPWYQFGPDDGVASDDALVASLNRFAQKRER